MGPSQPRIVGRYAIYGEIASGGMATVHFARLAGPSGFARTVAIKRAHSHLARDPDFTLMFLDEARLASRIRHSNVVSTIDVLSTPDDLVLVMDYVHGESLWKLVRTVGERNERVPVGIAATILIDTLHGLHAAHEATDERGAPLGIVHRDVSPQNILVGVDGITRLVDFGIAKAAGRLHTTRDSSVKGKYAYMAPEQVRGEPVSRLTDTYAAAIVFWELLTGERLFVGKTEAETIHRSLVSRVQPPSRLVPELGTKLDDILRKGLSRDPARRYQSAREMALDIESCVPAIRASEVGAWVERIAGDDLAARAQVLAAIERGETRAARPGVEQTATRAVSWSVETPGEAFTPARSGDAPPPSAKTNGASAETTAPARSRRTAILSGLLLALLGAFGAAAFVSARRPAPPAPPPRAAASSAPEASPPAPVIAAPSASPPPVVASAPTAEPSARPVATALPAPRPPPRPAPAPHPGHPKRSACDPPYSIDAAGRQIFKPECM